MLSWPCPLALRTSTVEVRGTQLTPHATTYGAVRSGATETQGHAQTLRWTAGFALGSLGRGSPGRASVHDGWKAAQVQTLIAVPQWWR